MTSTARLLEQRSTGSVRLRVEQAGPQIIREAGSSKVRLPRGSHEAILINTSGGLAGGDEANFHITAGEGSLLTVTSQAAERVYGSLGPPATVTVRLEAEDNARLAWLPLETLVFDGAGLSRQLEVDVAGGATFLAAEALVFGREASGEAVQKISLTDRWQVRRGGKLVHAEALRLHPQLPQGAAGLAGNRAMATVLFMGAETEHLRDRLQPLLSASDGVSAWNGKLVARLLAQDGFHLRKRLIPVLSCLAGPWGLPKTWTF